MSISKPSKVLAIETSCDETAAAVVSINNGGLVEVLGEAIASSQDMHIKTGGIVPEVAAREQLRCIVPVIISSLVQAAQLDNQSKDLRFKILDLSINKELITWVKNNIDAIAVTYGPGLIGSLLVGVETAKALAMAWNKPLLPVNHLHGHIYANWIDLEIKEQRTINKKPIFPALCLIVSGGHTELLLMNDHGQFELLGQTRDDAAGECFDKCARVLGLPYPGGPNLSACASLYSPTLKPTKVLPRPLLHSDSLDFSFSGLKAALVREVAARGGKDISQNDKQLLAYELETSVVEVLVKRVLTAVERVNPKSVLLCGGVAANTRLREDLKLMILNLERPITFRVPMLKYCTDNAAMIGAAAVYSNNQQVDTIHIKPNPDLSL